MFYLQPPHFCKISPSLHQLTMASTNFVLSVLDPTNSSTPAITFDRSVRVLPLAIIKPQVTIDCPQVHFASLPFAVSLYRHLLDGHQFPFRAVPFTSLCNLPLDYYDHLLFWLLSPLIILTIICFIVIYIYFYIYKYVYLYAHKTIITSHSYNKCKVSLLYNLI